MKVKFLRKKGSIQEGSIRVIEKERAEQLIQEKIAVEIVKKPTVVKSKTLTKTSKE